MSIKKIMKLQRGESIWRDNRATIRYIRISRKNLDYISCEHLVDQYWIPMWEIKR